LKGLYAITPDWPDTRRLLAASEAILAAAAAPAIPQQGVSRRHRQEQAVALRGLTRRFGALLIINDDVDLACLPRPTACTWRGGRRTRRGAQPPRCR